MTTPISFTVRPPSSSSYRPSPLGNGNNARQGAPSRRLFEQGDDDDEEDHRSSRRGDAAKSNGNGSSSRCVIFIPYVGRTDMYRAETAETPLVIPSLPNRDWKQSARRAPAYRPDGPKRTADDEVKQERTGDGPQRSGLRRIEREVKVEEVVVKQEPGVEQTTVTTTTSTDVRVKAEPLTLEEQALRALLAGDSQRESEEEKAQKELIIGAQANTRDVYREISEEEAFKRDVQALPEEVGHSPREEVFIAKDEQSTLDDYDAIPVSAFGLAMARGLGWDPKANNNTSIHEPKKRPQLLGLGATPMDPTIRPTHAKHGASKKDKQADRNAKTGRGFVATHLFEKRGKDGQPISNGSSRDASPSDSDSSKRRRIDNGDSDRDVKRERSDRDEDRSRARDDDRGQRRGGEYETEEERARRKARERERYRNEEYETEEERARRKARERERGYETEEERARRKAREREREYETEEERARRKAKERERDRRYDDRNGDRR